MRAPEAEYSFARRSGLALSTIFLLMASLSVSLVIARQSTPDLTGNWAVRSPNADGTVRTTYFTLKQEGSRITGSIRLTQFYYLITESTAGPDGFTLVGTMKDGANERRVTYEGKLVGDELHLTTRRRPEDRPTELV